MEQKKSASLKTAYAEGTEILKDAGITEHMLDAWYLLEYVTGVTKARYYMDPDRSMDSEAYETYLACIRKRATHIPLQHITGVQEFMGLEFAVNEHVLIPRQDTEVLVEETLEVLKRKSREISGNLEKFRSTKGEAKRKDVAGLEDSIRLLDLCTGSGCILISLLYYMKKAGQKISGTGADISEEALKVAEKNLRLLEEEGRPTLVQGDLFEHLSGTYDVIVSNPPYIRTAEIEKLEEEVKLHDPFGALDGKEDGLYFYRKIIEESQMHLKKQGQLLFEIGYDQGEAVSELMKNAGFEQVYVKKDLAGLDRVVSGVYTK